MSSLLEACEVLRKDREGVVVEETCYGDPRQHFEPRDLLDHTTRMIGHHSIKFTFADLYVFLIQP
jgi:hypothetical protein